MKGITVHRVFRAKAESGLPGVWVRALSDHEIQLRHQASMTVSAVLEKRLKDVGTTEYDAYIFPLSRLAQADLLEMCVAYKRRDIGADVARDIRPRFIPIPDKATAEEERAVILEREKELADLPGGRSSMNTHAKRNSSAPARATR